MSRTAASTSAGDRLLVSFFIVSFFLETVDDKSEVIFFWTSVNVLSKSSIFFFWLFEDN